LVYGENLEPLRPISRQDILCIINLSLIINDLLPGDEVVGKEADYLNVNLFLNTPSQPLSQIGRSSFLYDNLMKDLNLKPENVPLLAGEMVNTDQGGACSGMNKFIATLPQTIPNSFVIPSTGCVGAPDHLHFKADGYRTLGKRYAIKMLSILGYKISEN